MTICTHQKRHIFGRVHDDKMVLSPKGRIAEENIPEIVHYWQNVDVDYYVVMPNHVHIILMMMDRDNLSSSPANDVGTAFLLSEHKTDAKNGVPTLGQIVGNYKASVTRHIRAIEQRPDILIWQSRYHDHIIRHEADLNRIREYVLYNPARWLEDTFYNE